MATVQPPGFLQNLTNHTAETIRGHTNGLFSGAASAASLRGRGGVVRELGTALTVTANGSPNMTVNVSAGQVYISGSQGTKQGVYSGVNDASVSVAISASDPSNPRIDLIVAKVEDSAYSGAVNSWSIVAVTGVAASSPAVPAVPNNGITLAQIAVGAGVTSIVSGNITDKRQYAAALGAEIPCISTNRPTGSFSVGQRMYEFDTGFGYRWNGSIWVREIVRLYKSADEQRLSTTTLADATSLIMNVEANSSYVFDGEVYLLSSTAVDIKYGMRIPASASIRWSLSPSQVSTETSNTTIVFMEVLDVTVGGIAAGIAVNTHGRLHGRVTTAGTAGTVAFQFAQNVNSGAAAAWVLAGSWLNYWQVT